MNKKILDSLTGKVIKVNRGGHDSRVGKLMAVEEDYFVLFTKEDGVLYYKGHHVKSLTDNTKKGLQFDLEIPNDFTYIQGCNFKEVLEHLNYHWITVNRGGHEKLEGVLDNITKDYITLVCNEEVIRISMFHIKNVSYNLKIEGLSKKTDKKDNEKEDKTKNKEEDKKDNKSK
jgi:spore coat protein B